MGETVLVTILIPNSGRSPVHPWLVLRPTAWVAFGDEAQTPGRFWLGVGLVGLEWAAQGKTMWVRGKRLVGRAR
jgi:hypothetical protein